MSRGLIAGPTCDCVTCLVHKLVASCIAGGFTRRQPVTHARLYFVGDACHAEPAKKLIEKISPDACETHARSVEESIASLVLLISPVIPCSLASSLVLSLAICCPVSHLLGPCFVPGRRGLATIGHRTALGPPGYSLYPRVSELEKCLDNPYSVELIHGSPSAELQAVTMIPWH
jgi:hypothetical protein